jgi:hypothetical protein
VKETKRQGRIAHHHADATVPHIVALLGFSFHAAKIGIFRLSSKLFAIYFQFFAQKRTTFQSFSYLCNQVSANRHSHGVNSN